MKVFDVETTALPDEQLAKLKPEFVAPENYAKPEAIAAYVAKAEASWKEKAALNAKTARILAVGTMSDTGVFDCNFGREEESEAQLLKDFWSDWVQGEPMIGFAVKHFDAPMLIKRSWILGVTVPTDVITGRYFSHRIIDLQEVWCCYQRDITGESLDAVCKAFGLVGKNGDGKNFGKLWKEDRKQALSYLKNDLSQTRELAMKLGVMGNFEPPF